MIKTHNNIEMFKRRMIAEIARDKKKASVLAILTIAAVFFVGKLLIKSSPSAASGMRAADPVAEAPDDDPANGLPKIPKLGDSTKSTPFDRGHGPIKPRPRGEITRDIFRPNPKVFPLVAKASKSAGQPDVVQAKIDERTIALKARKERIRREGALLDLESTITGSVPIAIINGAVLGRGGVISGFRVVKIESQACVVEKEGVQLNLTMK